MKHATGPALDQLEPLLVAIRTRAGLKEKSRGVFYCKSQSLLHFHEDPKGLFADLRIGDEFQRFPVNSKTERTALLKALDARLAA
jgi:hypothetical protein